MFQTYARSRGRIQKLVARPNFSVTKNVSTAEFAPLCTENLLLFN
jgi:hypothetical protein